MNTRRGFYVVLVAILAGVAAFAFWWNGRAVGSSSIEPLRVRWLIAHQPVSLFDKAASVFENEFNARSSRSIEVELIGPDEYGSSTGRIPHEDIKSALRDGTVQIATEVIAPWAYESVAELNVLSLPFLFENDDHANRALESSVSDTLLAGIDAKTNTYGLAFTFSGGVMTIQSDRKQFRSAADLEGAHIGTANGTASVKTLESFGASPVRLDPGEGIRALQSYLSELDGIETPYPRIDPNTPPKYISEIKHSYFVTVVLANRAFVDGLSDHDKKVFKEAVQAAARQERMDSLALADERRASLRDAGTIITDLDTGSKDALTQRTRPVYQWFNSIASSDLVDKIRALR